MEQLHQAPWLEWSFWSGDNFAGRGGPGKEKKRAKEDFRGLLLFNKSHRSSSDGEARLFSESDGTVAYLSYLATA